jgi:SAM-dependent methyltransferase
MTWEETIQYIRTLPEYSELVEKAYFDENLALNVERFKASEEYQETLQLLKKYAPHAKSILDIGSGNGISAIALALDGYRVTVSEPDPSDTVGAGAVRALKAHYGISDMEIYEEFAENIQFPEGKFDVVYVRQAMHHAYDLPQFIRNLSQLIRTGGILMTIRDHVVFDEADKQRFLQHHPLQKFYGGENAFTHEEYTQAMNGAGLQVVETLRHFDSVINFFPLTKEQFQANILSKENEIKNNLISKIGFLGQIPLLQALFQKRVGYSRETFYDERHVPGRMYSYVSVKK